MKISSPLSTIMAFWAYIIMLMPTDAFSQKNVILEHDDFIEILVKFEENIVSTKKQTLIENTNAVVLKKFKYSDTELWRVPVVANTKDNVHSGTAAIAEYMNSYPDIQYIEPNYSIQIFGQPDDPAFNQLWALKNSGQSNGLAGADINAVSAWDVSTGSTEAIVGVLDTGIDWSHQDLAENIWQNLGEDADGDGQLLELDSITGQWVMDTGDLDGVDNDNNGYIDDLIGWDFINNDNNPFDDHGHGTHVAGTIGAKGNNSIGTTGVAWNVRLMPLKIFDQTGNGSVGTAKEALEYALNMGAQISNHSWGILEHSLAFLETLETALNNEHIIVAAAGNADLNNDLFPVYPASYDLENIIAVTATNRQDGFTTFSNYGENFVDIGAPGKSIYSTLPGNFYGSYSGTSMAAPHVAGTLALAWGVCHNYTGLELKTQLLNSATGINSLIGKCKTAGRLNAGDFIQAIASPDAGFSHLPFDTLRVELSAINQNFSSYFWDFGDGMTETTTDNTVSHIYAASGNYAICLTVSDNCGEQHTSCKDTYISVGNIPADCTPTWTQYANGDYILALAEQGNYIWAGSTGGLSRINKMNGTHYLYSSANSGLPHNHINTIAIDQNGTKWIGMEKGGLAKFDGSSWQVFNTSNSGLPHNNVQAISISPSNTLWMATKGGGLAEFDGQTNWIIHNAQNSILPTDILSDVIFVSPSKIYVSTASLGMVELISGTWWNTGNGLPSNKIHDIAYDAQADEFWVATNNGLAYRTASNNWIVYTATNSLLRGNNVLTVEVDNTTGMKWIGTWGGVHQFDGTAWIIDDNYSSGGMLLSNSVNAVLPSTSGTAWMGTNRSLTRLNNGQWDNFTGLNALLPDNRVNEIIEDKNGDIWVATEGCLAKFDHENWLMYNTFNSPLPSETIYTLYSDENEIWVGAYGGLLRIDPDLQLETATGSSNWDLYTSELPGDMVWTITKDSTGNLWVGTYGDGLVVYDGTNWTTYDTNNSILPDNTIEKIIFDTNDNSIWIATQNGAVQVDNAGNWTLHDSNSGMPVNTVYDIDVDADGVKWFTLWNNNIASYDNTNWVTHNDLTAGLTGQVKMLCIDTEGEKLLGTTHGVCRIGEEGATAYNTLNTGLPDNQIRSITVDPSGNRWYGTAGGLGVQSALAASFIYQQEEPCLGNTVTFMSASSNVNTQRWYINGIGVGQSPMLTHTFPESGTYEVRLLVENADDCTASFVEEITIGDRASDLSLTPMIDVCDDYIDLNAELDNLQTYRWYKDEIMLSNAATYRAEESGTYILKITDWCGETGEDTTEVMLSYDCIWPGDTNDDGQVNMKDILPVGRSAGLVAVPRSGASILWEGQTAPPDILDGANSYADADGNGIVDSTDILVIEDNYGNIHGEPSTEPTLSFLVPPVASLRPVLESASIFNGNDSLELSIILANELTFPFSSYGIAYSLEHGSNFTEVDFSNSWLGDDNSALLTLDVDDNGNRTDIAITRTDQLDFEGAGVTSGIITLQDLPTGGSAGINYTYNFRLTNILLVDSEGNEIPVQGHDLTLTRSTGSPIAVAVENTSYTCLEYGKARAIPYGGVSPYTYLWETGEQTAIITGLFPGIHRVTVTDANGISQVGEARVVAPYAINLFTNVQPETDGMMNGTASVIASGSAGYSYLWSTGQTTTSISGLEAGTYSVTVTDELGCSAVEQVIVAGTVIVKAKVLLEGPYDPTTGLMKSLLNQEGLLPYGSPYETGESTNSNAFLGLSNNDDVVDWVLIELRHQQDTSVVARRAALLQRDGDVTDFDGEAIQFKDVPADDYYIAIRHRNHLSMISATPLPVNAGENEYAFLTPGSVMELPFGLKELGQGSGIYAMYAGNAANSDPVREEITGLDKTIWDTWNGIFGYYVKPDFDLSGDVNGGDKAKWFENNGIFNTLPE